MDAPVRKNKSSYRELKISNKEALNKIETELSPKEKRQEYMPWGRTSYLEIAETILTDKLGRWESPLFFVEGRYSASFGIKPLCKKALDYIDRLPERKSIDILSISGRLDNDWIILNILVRSYCGTFPFNGFSSFIGENKIRAMQLELVNSHSGKLRVPDNADLSAYTYTKKQREEHDLQYKKQTEILNKGDDSTPFLNQLTEYVPKKLPEYEDENPLVYDLLSLDKKISLAGSYEDFIQVFHEVLSYANGSEYYTYMSIMAGEGENTEETFMQELELYIRNEYIETNKLLVEDLPALKKKLYQALFQLYIVQDLIDDPLVTDVKITAYDSVRCRINGKAYISNISFIDDKDFVRFVNGICVRNHILTTVPEQTFTDTHDENYILRMTVSAAYIMAGEIPNLHIRKVSRKKMLGDDLIKAGMFTPKVMDYLLDAGKFSRGVVFAGPPGSGKTICLNWFLEKAYEESAEILVIQENDELFAYRKGIMFQHVVSFDSTKGDAINLEGLGQLALVAGANVFVIGESKGGEICSAMTLSNSGCRTAITVHSDSAEQTIPKMADLAMRGYAQSMEQAKRMLKSFQTIVYLQDFKVQEITEILGFDEEKKDMEYRYIYKRSLDKEALEMDKRLYEERRKKIMADPDNS